MMDFTPAYYEERAEETRTIAGTMKDPGCRASWLQISRQYTMMARQAQQIVDARAIKK